VDGHVVLVGVLEPIDDLFYCLDFCVEGSLLVTEIAGALSDGGAFSLVILSDKPAEVGGFAVGAVCPGVDARSGPDPWDFKPNLRGTDFRPPAFFHESVVVARF
jgi:hypothetical protein